MLIIKKRRGDFPPAFVMTCTGDFLASQAPLLLKALMEKKVPHICNQNECDFFRSLMEEKGGSYNEISG
jgi:acetyl esterase/lipase